MTEVCFDEGNAAKAAPETSLSMQKIESALETICREGGWDVSYLARTIGFETAYQRPGKGNHKVKLPPKASFVYLGGGIDAVHSGYHFILGQRRTGQDPQGGSLIQNWSFYRNIDIIESDDVTAFAKFILFPSGKLYVHEIQASVIDDDYDKVVRDEMRTLSSTFGPVEKRLYNLSRYGVPWDYADRMLLFSPMAVWFSRMADVQEIVFDKLNDCPIHLRAYQYLSRHVQAEGIAVSLDSRPEA